MENHFSRPAAEHYRLLRRLRRLIWLREQLDQTLRARSRRIVNLRKEELA